MRQRILIVPRVTGQSVHNAFEFAKNQRKQPEIRIRIIQCTPCEVLNHSKVYHNIQILDISKESHTSLKITSNSDAFLSKVQNLDSMTTMNDTFVSIARFLPRIRDFIVWVSPFLCWMKRCVMRKMHLHLHFFKLLCPSIYPCHTNFEPLKIDGNCSFLMNKSIRTTMRLKWTFWDISGQFGRLLDAFRTDRRTNGRPDRPFYRDPWTHLKI